MVNTFKTFFSEIWHDRCETVSKLGTEPSSTEHKTLSYASVCLITFVLTFTFIVLDR